MVEGALDPQWVLAVRDDGQLALSAGWPPGIGYEDLADPLVMDGDGGALVVGAPLRVGEDDELIARFGRFRDPRAAVLDVDDLGAVLPVLAFTTWRARTGFCSACGGRLEVAGSGRVLRCVGCAVEHFPRVEPAVIVRVIDGDERVLLARQEGWPPAWFSTLAGFVEPGETLETTVRREVAEEVGVRVGAVTYVASQPWPFPASLMLGFEAVAETTELVLEDGEIAEARWMGRAELGAAMAAGEVLVPPPMSIAHRLVAEWYGAEMSTWRRR